MGEEQMELRFSWVLKKFSSLPDEKCYSRPFSVAGVNWCLAAHRKGDNNNGHLYLFLEFADPDSLPPGWSRDVKFSLTLVTKGFGKSNILMGTQRCFNEDMVGCGCEFVSLTKLHDKSEGFLVNNSSLIILAKLLVLPAVVAVPDGTVKITEPLSCKDGDQADGTSVGKSQGDSSCEAAQKTENTNLDDVEGSSEENSDDNGTSDEGTGDGGLSKEDVDSDDASSPLSDDGSEDISLLNQSSALEDASYTVGNDGTNNNTVTAETEVSNDDAPKEDVGDEASSLVSNDSASNGTSLDQVKSLEDASQTVGNGGRGFNTVTSATETAMQPTKETIDVNGFDVFSSQVESVSHIFRRHPDIAIGFRPKNRQIKRAYMNELLSLIEILCQSPEKLSEDDLSNADDTLADLIDVGFKLDWLKKKLDEVSEKKKKEQGSGERLRTMEEQLQKLKLMFMNLETQLQMEKAEALAARAPLSFNDVVC